DVGGIEGNAGKGGADLRRFWEIGEEAGGTGGTDGVGFDDDDGGIAENAGGEFGDIFVGAGDGGTADGVGAAILGNVGIVGRGGALGAAIGRLFGTESAGDFAGTRRRIMKFWGRKWILAGIAVWAFSGCSVLSPVKDSTQYFLLDIPEYEAVTVTPVENPKTVGLGRVRVARYLESPGMAVRERGHAVIYSSRHRWAEPLDASIGR